MLAMWRRVPRERQRSGRIVIIFPYELNRKFDILNALWVQLLHKGQKSIMPREPAANPVSPSDLDRDDYRAGQRQLI